ACRKKPPKTLAAAHDTGKLQAPWSKVYRISRLNGESLMLEWLESIAGPQFVPAVLWTLAVLVALVAIVIGIRTVRRASSGTFVAGGRSRKTRLAVMDATAVDSHRRLVLVRRDDVEHLLLIGGASDIVVEPNIRLNGPIRR